MGRSASKQETTNRPVASARVGRGNNRHRLGAYAQLGLATRMRTSPEASKAELVAAAARTPAFDPIRRFAILGRVLIMVPMFASGG